MTVVALSLVSSRPPQAPDTKLADMLETRRSVGVLRLSEPGPTAGELRRLLTIAARVPDHGALALWRFIVVEGPARQALASRLGEACTASADDGPGVGDQAIRTSQKLKALFGHPPLVVIVVSRPNPTSSIPVWEQTLSVGAACMNLITAATALGYGANWLTGWAASHPAARPILGLADSESVAGVIPIGRVAESSPERARPDVDAIVTAWAD